MSEQATAAQQGTTQGEAQGTSQTKSSIEEKTFTQEQINKIVEERLRRDRESEGYSEMKRKAEEYDKLAEADKTELQKATDALAEANKKLDMFEQKAKISEWAKEVSKETGVPVEALRGSTKEELMEHAEILKPRFQDDATPYIGNEGGQQGKSVAASDEQVFASFMDQKFK